MSFGFFTHDAVLRLLLRSADNNAVNARVEDKLSKMEQSMQQQHQRDTSLLHEMSMALDITNAKLVHLDKALLARSRFLATTTTATRRRSATQQQQRRRQEGAR